MIGKKKGKVYKGLTSIMALIVAMLMVFGLASFAAAEQEWLPGYGDKNGTLGKDGQSWRVGWVNSSVFEGPTSNAFHTFLSADDPSAVNRILLPDESGTILTTGGAAASIPLADTKVLVGQGTGLSAPFAISGDSTMTNGGVMTNDKIDNKAVDFGDVTTGNMQAANGTLWDSVSHTLTGPVTGTMTSAGVVATTVTAGVINSSMLTAKGWSVMVAGSKAAVTGSATQTVTNNSIGNENLMFVSYATTDDTDSLVTVTNSDHSVMTTVLSADPASAHSYDYVGIINNPSIGDAPWQIVGAFNSASAGGDATETVAVAGSLTTDILVVSMGDDGANDVTIAAAAISSDGTATITLSADPGTAARVTGMVVRANSTDDTATHTIVYAGSLPTVGAAAVEDFTVTGVLASDIVIVVQSTKTAQQFEFANASAADTISVTFDADPGADEVISYIVLRAI